MKGRDEGTVTPARGAGERDRTGGEGGDIDITFGGPLSRNRHTDKYCAKRTEVE